MRRRQRRLGTASALGILVALVASACHGAPDIIGPKAVRIRGPIHTDGTRIVDATGRVVRFNGVGTREFVPTGAGGAACSGHPDPDEIKNIVDWGFNSIRVPLAWASIEPTAPTVSPDGAVVHHWNEPLLTSLDAFVDDATGHGLAVILGMHLRYHTNPDKGQCNGASMPDWVDPPPNADPEAAEEAKCAFLQGTTPDGPAGSTWDGFAALWQMLAERYASNPQVVGADVVNEPYPVGSCTPSNVRLDDLYAQLGAEIRRVDPRISIIIEDSPPNQALNGSFEVTQSPPFDNVIYSYHCYQPNWTPNGMAVNDAYLEHAQALNLPLLVGEFNAFGYAAPGTEYDGAWARDTATAMASWKEDGVSWIIASYKGGNHIVEKHGGPRADLISAIQRGY